MKSSNCAAVSRQAHINPFANCRYSRLLVGIVLYSLDFKLSVYIRKLPHCIHIAQQNFTSDMQLQFCPTMRFTRV